MPNELKPEDEMAFAFWVRYYDEWGKPPAIEDVGRAIGVAPPNNATRNLKRLAAAGKLVEVVAPNGRRFYRLPADDRRGFSLPVLGRVAAGRPNAVLEQDSERFYFKERFGGDGFFMLQVRGDSMVEDHIADGDWVVLRPVEEAQTGDVVVAEIDGETTLKVYRHVRGVEWLFPRNKEMEPIRVDTHADCRIRGVMVGMVRDKRKGRRK